MLSTIPKITPKNSITVVMILTIYNKLIEKYTTLLEPRSSEFPISNANNEIITKIYNLLISQVPSIKLICPVGPGKLDNKKLTDIVETLHIYINKRNNTVKNIRHVLS